MERIEVSGKRGGRESETKKEMGRRYGEEKVRRRDKKGKLKGRDGMKREGGRGER